MNAAGRGAADSIARDALGLNLTFGMLDSLGSAIVAGTYDSDTLSTEAGLSSQYDVSRSVTREAVKMLCAKGMLSARPGQGVTVRPPARWNRLDPDVMRWMLCRTTSGTQLVQFDQLRLAIEPEAAFLAAGGACRADLDSLDDALSRIHAAIDLHAKRDARADFHLTVLRASGNPLFAQFRELVRIALYSPARLAGRSGSAAANVSMYVAVVEAIAKRDPAAARLGMRNIVNHAIDALN